MNTTVWAFQPLPELNNATGFVECDAELAARLMAAGQVQDPRDGATALRTIGEVVPPPAPPAPQKGRVPLNYTDDGEDDDHLYKTKVLTAKKPRKRNEPD